MASPRLRPPKVASMPPRNPQVVVTATGAVCASGMDPAAILDEVLAGKSAIGPIAQWDTTGWPVSEAGEIVDFNARALVEDRKLHKLIRRTDLLGLYAAGRAIEGSTATARACTWVRAAATTRTSTTTFR
jgi:3-oxoacyl-(acyl-carrier-protein) synthase